MRWIAVTVACLLTASVLFIAFILGVSEFGGEVVTLTTSNDADQPQETHLWIVDDSGHEWLRAGQPSSSWLVRLQARPDVTVTRAGTTRAYLAEPVRDPATRDRINALMAKKYGTAESVIAATRKGEFSVPIRLVPKRAN